MSIVRSAAQSTVLAAWSLTGFLLASPLFAQGADPARPAPAPLTTEQRMLRDWASLARYREENARLAPPAKEEARVVFMGDSITDGWGRGTGTFFPGKPYVNRGISGQTTPQMLVRFRPDVIALKPKVVVILAGINDIAQNTGPTTPEAIQDNLMSMVDLAEANGIQVVLASITPAYAFGWRPGLEPAGKIRAMNNWMRDYAERRGLVFLDYHSALTNGEGGFKAELSSDGVHPNEAGYAIMVPLAEKAIAQALAKPAPKR